MIRSLAEQMLALPGWGFVRRRHLDRGERYLTERGGRAVFLGRFTAGLRVMVPGLAGMAGMPYRAFLPYNVTGGAASGSR
jgi:undecaprenyl-diphosphatase